MKKLLFILSLLIIVLIFASILIYIKTQRYENDSTKTIINTVELDIKTTDEIKIAVQDAQLEEAIIQLKDYKTSFPARPIDQIRLFVTSKPFTVTNGYVLKNNKGDELIRRYIDNSNSEISDIRIYINDKVIKTDPNLANKYLFWGLLDILEANYPDSNKISQDYIDNLSQNYSNVFNITIH